MNEKFNFKKKYGQNFINDKNILNKIVNSININSDDLVIEIGPGSGALTEFIVNKTNKVICYEIDKDLDIYLNKYKDVGVTIKYEDFLKADVLDDIKNIDYNKLYIISNLPYYITTPIINSIIDKKIPVTSCLFMMQKEVGDRIKAKPGSKNYSSLSIFIDYYFEVKKVLDVSRNVFYPKPNVDSIVLLFNMRENKKVEVINEDIFFKLIRDSFSYKRKTLKNNLKSYNLDIIEKVLKKYNYDLSIRAEKISIELFCEIANALS